MDGIHEALKGMLCQCNFSTFRTYAILRESWKDLEGTSGGVGLVLSFALLSRQEPQSILELHYSEYTVHGARVDQRKPRGASDSGGLGRLKPHGPGASTTTTTTQAASDALAAAPTVRHGHGHAAGPGAIGDAATTSRSRGEAQTSSTVSLTRDESWCAGHF